MTWLVTNFTQSKWQSYFYQCNYKLLKQSKLNFLILETSFSCLTLCNILNIRSDDAHYMRIYKRPCNSWQRTRCSWSTISGQRIVSGRWRLGDNRSVPRPQHAIKLLTLLHLTGSTLQFLIREDDHQTNRKRLEITDQRLPTLSALKVDDWFEGLSTMTRDHAAGHYCIAIFCWKNIGTYTFRYCAKPVYRFCKVSRWKYRSVSHLLSANYYSAVTLDMK